jgi:starch synthase
VQVLFVTSEAHPLIKTGGLADVSGALPNALLEIDVDIKLLIPGYPEVFENLKDLTSLGFLEPFIGVICEIFTGKFPNSHLDVITFKCDELFAREGKPYTDANGKDWQDNALRFGTLSKISAMLSSENSILNWLPELVHCNDWQTGLTPYYLTKSQSPIKSIMTIHNMAFQGCFNQEWIERLGLLREDFSINGYEYYGQISFLKAGIFYANQIATVSPTYAIEIQTAAYGFGMHGLLQTRAHDITGILNGIDTEEWDPEMDPYLPYPYTSKKLAGKSMLKAHLLEKMQLPSISEKPLLGMVSRITHQKGSDIVLEAIPELVAQGYQLVILGSGDTELENAFKKYAVDYPANISITIGYNESLSHLVMAGVDIFLMPSRFEPCGLNQFYGLRYGTPPIVAKTGGLVDSICNTSAETLKNNTANGFMIENVNKVSLLVTIEQANLYWKNKKIWMNIQNAGMKKALGWEISAIKYLELYAKTLTM